MLHYLEYRVEDISGYVLCSQISHAALRRNEYGFKESTEVEMG